MPDDTSSQSSPSPPPSTSSPKLNHLKRKERPEEEVKQERPQDPLTSTNPLPAGANVRPDEYALGFITCEHCGTDVNFRDGSTGFTTEHWEAHKASCPPPVPAAVGDNGSAMYAAPDRTTGPDSLSQPPTKRRRAKRTEDERIQYLQNDPYVGQFEPYRVLCASCDKWIRLRPNSTYCSIPWDAHRKSCLAKKINNKNVYALEERNSLFSKDPDVRKFDPERLLCNMCDKWLSVPPDDHLQAVQKWVQHRASCQKTAGSSAMSHPDAAGQPQIHPSAERTSQSPASPNASGTPGSTTPHMQLLHPRFPPLSASGAASDSPSSFHDLNPINYAPAHESRRRNAEQRAATLRADRLIGEVEPNRVFCTLCQKWVQLRQDSSYCAYPWLQHRGKCLARHQRRTQKATEMADMKARKQHLPSHRREDEDELMSDREAGRGGPSGHRDRDASEDFESEEGAESGVEDRSRRKEKARMDQRQYHPSAPTSSSAMGSRHHYGAHNVHQATHHAQHPHQHHPGHPSHHYKSRSGPYGQSSAPVPRFAGGSMSQAVSSSAYRQDPRGGSSSLHPSPHMHSRQPVRRPSYDEEMDLDADGEADADGDFLDDEVQPMPPPTPPAGSSRASGVTRAALRRPWPVGLADLDSPSGRKQFIFGSVEYLFATTYESTDDMSISALLAYLNAAMPQDKHEDFDTSEVARAVGAMKEKGRVVFEGDILRLID